MGTKKTGSLKQIFLNPNVGIVIAIFVVFKIPWDIYRAVYDEVLWDYFAEGEWDAFQHYALEYYTVSAIAVFCVFCVPIFILPSLWAWLYPKKETTVTNAELKKLQEEKKVLADRLAEYEKPESNE